MYLDFLKRYHLKIGSYMLLLIMFSSFSTAFHQKSFTSTSHVSIIFLCFFNFGCYLLFTAICYFVARPWFIPKLFPQEPIPGTSTKWYMWSYKIFRPFYYNKRDSICIMFCGPAKTAALGTSLITSQYGDDKEHLGKILVPLVLYQAIQVLTGSFFVPLFRRWAKDEIEEYENEVFDEENQDKMSNTSSNSQGDISSVTNARSIGVFDLENNPITTDVDTKSSL